MSEQAPDTPRPSPLARLRLVLWLLVPLAAGLGAYLATNPPGGAGRAPASYSDEIGGPFALTAPDGSTVTDQTLRGRPYALFFGFTRCPDVCPTTLARLAQLRARLGKAGDDFEIVFVSVDPEQDTPELVGRYIALFGTPIIGLTGTTEQVDQAVRAFRAHYEKVPLEGGGYTVDHTASVYLMDAEGRLQSILDYHESAQASLAKLERLVR